MTGMAPFARVKTRALLPFTRSSNLSNSYSNLYRFTSRAVHLWIRAIFRRNYEKIPDRSAANRKDCVIRAAIVGK